MTRTIKLNSGYDMPLVGFGCWKVTNDTCAETVYNAIKTGYRLFDCAQDYGNCKEIGQGLKKAFDEGVVKREDLFITSKLWNNYHDPKHVEEALDKVLSDMQLSYLDLFLIHFPIAFKYVPIEEKYPPGFYCGDGDNFHYEKVPLLETWKAMEALTETGKVRSVGISNFNASLILDLLRGCKLVPAVLQIEHHPYLQQPQLVEFCNKNGIAITGYSSFGPQSFLELNQDRALKTPTLFEHDVIKSIANNHKKTPAQILLRWATQRNIAVIPKSNNQGRLLQNLEVVDFDLTTEELKKIESLDIKLRFNDPWDWDKIPIFY
ncbi:NAD(P)H-dependent D-xylose reductase (XR) [Scheffersomyces spartinae]|uniref:NAD(P)H-dependent D-xylose reductase n=1 Tax=Scheffersomyces spartinae TaxID=45513 RepID=A0A9P7V7K7_9ASCO|nr:NAD(P)H-dependent D-xylose reductase (XR) [Scheffersomyces spartinae]KAG7192706.1 NAD(P)H-dependent D-xylose reductase (XR) [Scheffersomyces spartinae]